MVTILLQLRWKTEVLAVCAIYCKSHQGCCCSSYRTKWLKNAGLAFGNFLLSTLQMKIKVLLVWQRHFWKWISLVLRNWDCRQMCNCSKNDIGTCTANGSGGGEAKNLQDFLKTTDIVSCFLASAGSLLFLLTTGFWAAAVWNEMH